MPFQPPFKLATGAGIALGAAGGRYGAACCREGSAPIAQEPGPVPEAARPGRLKLAELDGNFQCSIIGTCMSTGALRKAMSRFIHVDGVSDLEIHHEAVLRASEPGPASKALHKALDHQHEATLARFARVADADALAALWDEAQRSGDIPGAYWALMTHRHATGEVRKKVFGDVHMLSHLVGAANRADIRRLVALERAAADLREQLDGHQQRHIAQEQQFRSLQRELAAARQVQAAPGDPAPGSDESREHQARAAAAAGQVAVQTQRREAAEQSAAAAQASAVQLADEVASLRKHAATLAAELGAAESQLRLLAGGANGGDNAADPDRRLAGRRILYVGGRPSSTPSIRALVERHGGDFRHHDGGLEDRKGLLAAGVSWADLVVFPVDCVDHDSVGQLKRLCSRHAIEFWPLRSAGVGSFAAALAVTAPAAGRAESTALHPCRKQG